MPNKRKLPDHPSDIPKRKSSRLAAKSIKSIPKSEQIAYEKLTLTLADNGHAVYIEIVKDPETSEEWEFEPTREGCMVRNLQDQSENQVEGVNFIEAAGEQFVEILKTPNLHLKQLFIDLEPPRSICRKVEAAHKMCHPEDEEFKCTPPEGIDTLYFSNSIEILEILGTNLKLVKTKLPVERFRIEVRAFQSYIAPILSALEPITLKEIEIDNSLARSTDLPLVNSEQWKNAERLECFGEKNMKVEHWKHFKTVDIALKKATKEELDEIMKTFLFLSTWEHVSMLFCDCKVRRSEYFQNLQISGAPIIPGIVDNWVIEVPKMNHKVFVIFSEGTLHLIRKHWVVNRRKKVAIRRKFRKLEAVFEELPGELARSVVEQLDEMSKRSLRQTCRSLHNTVNTTGSTYEKLTLTLADNRSAIFIELFVDAENRLELEFEQDPLGYTVKNPQEGWERTVIYNQYRHRLKPQFDFIGAAVQHFLKIFKKKTVVKKLCLVTEGPRDTGIFLPRTMTMDERVETICKSSRNNSANLKQLKNKLLEVLAKNQHCLRVQHFECPFGDTRFSVDTNHTLHVLKFLDPKFLERITISGELSEEEVQRVSQFEICRSAKEFCSYTRSPPTLCSHFARSEIYCTFVPVESMETLFNALFVSTTWENVLITCGWLNRDAEQFLNRLEDQRPVDSRMINSKLIKIPNIHDQFINYQLIGQRNISFTRVIQ